MIHRSDVLPLSWNELKRIGPFCQVHFISPKLSLFLVFAGEIFGASKLQN